MHNIGTAQFKQKRYKFLPLPDGRWVKFLGQLMAGFIAIIYGKPGQGKTEFCVMLAKILSTIGKTVWLSYEQAHGFDLQRAINRNDPNGVIWSNPHEKLPKARVGETKRDLYFRDLMDFVKKRNPPLFLFVDSLKYTGFTLEMYEELKRACADRICLIIIDHGKGNEPKTALGQDVKFDCHLALMVKGFIAYNEKNRLGGKGEFIINEEIAREMNKLYFKMLDEMNKLNAQPEKPKRGRKKKEVADE